MTPPMLRLGAESRLSSGLCHGPKTGSRYSRSTGPRMTPCIALWVRTHEQGPGEPHLGRTPHNTAHRSDTEKERVQASQRDLARRPTASQRAARARAVCSGREDGTASGRGLTRSAPARRCPRAKKRSQDTKGTSTTAHAPPRAARPHKKNGPAAAQPAALPRLQFNGTAGHDAL